MGGGRGGGGRTPSQPTFLLLLFLFLLLLVLLLLLLLSHLLLLLAFLVARGNFHLPLMDELFRVVTVLVLSYKEVKGTKRREEKENDLTEKERGRRR